MRLSDDLMTRAANSDDEHDAAMDLVEELERRGLDSLLLGQAGATFRQDKIGPRRRPRKVQRIVKPRALTPALWLQAKARRSEQ